MEPQTLTTARKIADEVFFPAALEVERAGAVPVAHLDLLAAEGLYGLAAPPDVSSLEQLDFPAICRVVETLASGCLATTFVWVQHHSAVMAATRTPNEAARERWLAPLAAGRRRAGLAIGSAVRPGAPGLRAIRDGDGWRLEGEASWITGWGLIDTLYLAARAEDDTLVWVLLDLADEPALSTQRLELASVDATCTVSAQVDGLRVDDSAVIATMPLAAWQQQDAGGLRFNGSLPLGVAARCAQLLEPAVFTQQLDAVRGELDGAGPDELPGARAAAAALALRAASALVVQTGSGSVLTSNNAQRLLREAMFLLVFGSRPGIKQGLTERLSRG